MASEEFRPVFFLSTGRCGTRWFTELLGSQKRLDVHHNTDPELYEQSLLAYQLRKNGAANSPPAPQLLDELIYTARQSIMYDAIERGHRYVETNNRISFFAPELARLFPHAQFVHLYRDPAGFVKSGMNRGWYNGSRYDHARLFPTQEPEKSAWSSMSEVAKISWLWRETNQEIDSYLAAINPEQYKRFNFAELSAESVSELMDWLQIDLKPEAISKRINTVVNAQKKGTFPSYSEWKEDDKAAFQKHCGDYAKSLGFIYEP